MHYTLANEISDLAGDSKVAWNRMAVTCMELGMDVWKRLLNKAPSVAKEVLRVRRGPLSKRGQISVAGAVQRLVDEKELEDRLALAVPTQTKRRLEREKRRTGVSMSAQVRRRLETA